MVINFKRNAMHVGVYTLFGIAGSGLGYLITFFSFQFGWYGIVKPIVSVLSALTRAWGDSYFCEGLGSVLCIFIAQLVIMLALSVVTIACVRWYRKKHADQVEPISTAYLGVLLTILLLSGVVGYLLSPVKPTRQPINLSTDKVWIIFDSTSAQEKGNTVVEVFENGQFFVADPNSPSMKVLKRGSLTQEEMQTLKTIVGSLDIGSLGPFYCQQQINDEGQSIYTLAVNRVGQWERLMNICSSNTTIPAPLIRLLGILDSLSSDTEP